MDNLGAHEDRRVKELIEARGRELLDLPPYPPGLERLSQRTRDFYARPGRVLGMLLRTRWVQRCARSAFAPLLNFSRVAGNADWIDRHHGRCKGTRSQVRQIVADANNVVGVWAYPDGKAGQRRCYRGVAPGRNLFRELPLRHGLPLSRVPWAS